MIWFLHLLLLLPPLGLLPLTRFKLLPLPLFMSLLLHLPPLLPLPLLLLLLLLGLLHHLLLQLADDAIQPLGLLVLRLPPHHVLQVYVGLQGQGDGGDSKVLRVAGYCRVARYCRKFL